MKQFIQEVGSKAVQTGFTVRHVFKRKVTLGAKKKPLREARGHNTLVLRENNTYLVEQQLQEALILKFLQVGQQICCLTSIVDCDQLMVFQFLKMETLKKLEALTQVMVLLLIRLR